MKEMGDFSEEKVRLAQTKYAHKFSSSAQQWQNVGVGKLHTLWSHSDDIVIVHASCSNDGTILLSEETNTSDWHPTSPVLTVMIEPKAIASHEAIRKLLPKLVKSISKVSRAIEAAEREQDGDIDEY